MQKKDLPNEEIYHGKLLNLRIQTVPESSGGANRYEIVEHPGSVAVVALCYEQLDDQKLEPCIVLVSQKRPAIGKMTWEIPAGLVEADERQAPELAAARELREETGYIADTWQCLLHHYPAPGYSTEMLTIYLAQQVHLAPDEPGDSTEIAQVRWIPLNEALKACSHGEIEDGKTLLAIYLTHYLLIK